LITSFQHPFRLTEKALRVERWTLERKSPKVNQVQGDETEGGVRGGEIVAEGTPEEVAVNPRSFTGQYLSAMFGERRAAAE